MNKKLYGFYSRKQLGSVLTKSPALYRGVDNQIYEISQVQEFNNEEELNSFKNNYKKTWDDGVFIGEVIELIKHIYDPYHRPGRVRHNLLGQRATFNKK